MMLTVSNLIVRVNQIELNGEFGIRMQLASIHFAIDLIVPVSSPKSSNLFRPNLMKNYFLKLQIAYQYLLTSTTINIPNLIHLQTSFISIYNESITS